ncbi:hypothetical protein HaLaN_15668 [Haematococcus lacustris]|uniref:Uncharacterized protein n=1 Tax=Haematococcus lacustris TaxID=44745 RepID=A0A699Z817_HAELA|nr:hypothetical protein HaLaN_15668 [Haematococcus lacustris]
MGDLHAHSGHPTCHGGHNTIEGTPRPQSYRGMGAEWGYHRSTYNEWQMPMPIAEAGHMGGAFTGIRRNAAQHANMVRVG